MLAALLWCALGCIRIAAADDGPTPPRLVDAPRDVVLPAGGAAVSVPLRARDAAGIRLQLVRAPAGMRLQAEAEAAADGGWTLRWDDPEQRFATDAVLEAVVRGVPSRRQRIEIRFLPAGELPPLAPEPASSADSDAAAPALSLAPVPRQMLRVGRPWELWLRPRVTPSGGEDASAAARPILVLDSAPEALTIEPAGGGWYRLALTPAEPGQVEFEVVAQYADGRPGEAWQPVRLTILDEADEADEPASDPVTVEPDVADPDAPEGSWPPDAPLQVPGFEPLSNPIVSAGRPVVFTVRPVLPDGQRAVVQIDRLPRTARFDEAEDGSRTFHWLTGERDQGEHLFRLTAVNLEDAALRDTTEIVVIVGDPTRGKSAPAQ